MLPNFLIIGAARSGTTALFSLMQQHADIYLPAAKRPEPHFFYKNAEYAKGLHYYEQRYFSGWLGQRAVGEASTSYVFGSEVPRRIRAHLPDVRLICLLRNPIERAFSSYWHTVRSGLEKLSFEEAIASEAERKAGLAGTPLGEIAPFAYVERGLYHGQLVRWLDVFDRSQLHIVIFEDFVATPARSMAGMARFLGVRPEGFGGHELARENQSVPAGARMTRSMRDCLAGRFSNDVDQLGKLLGRDLMGWLDEPSPSLAAALHQSPGP